MTTFGIQFKTERTQNKIAEGMIESLKKILFSRTKWKLSWTVARLLDRPNKLKPLKSQKRKPEVKMPRSRSKLWLKKVNIWLISEGGIFCICRKPYENEMDMIECEICDEWYHYKCIGFIGTEADAQTLEFHCMKCMKFQSEEEKSSRL